MDIEGEETEDESLTYLLNQLGGQSNVEVRIFRCGKGYHGKQSYLDTVEADEFSPKMLQDVYGGGSFRIHVRQDGKLKRNVGIEVCPPINKEVKTEEKDIFAELAHLQQQNTEVIITAIGAMGNNFAQAIKEVIATQAPQRSKTEEMQETLNMMVAMKQVMGDNKPQIDSTEIFMKGLEFAKSITPRDGEPTSLEVLMEGAKQILPAIAQMSEKTNDASPSPATVPVKQEKPSKKGVKKVINPIKKIVQGAINQIFEAKNKSTPIAKIADTICYEIPQKHLDSLLAGDNWFDKLMKHDKRVKTEREFFEELRNKILFEDEETVSLDNK